MWIALATPLVIMLGAVGMQRLEPEAVATPTSDDPLQQPLDVDGATVS